MLDAFCTGPEKVIDACYSTNMRC